MVALRNRSGGIVLLVSSLAVVHADGPRTGSRQAAAPSAISPPPFRLEVDSIVRAPSSDGVWDETHRRVPVVQVGDIALIDSIDGTRRLLTRTAPVPSDAERTKP